MINSELDSNVELNNKMRYVESMFLHHHLHTAPPESAVN